MHQADYQNLTNLTLSCIYSLLKRVSQQEFWTGMPNEGFRWALWRCMRDCHGLHTKNGSDSDNKGRAGRASVSNCDIKILPKATTDSETTLWQGRQFCVGCTSQMLSRSRALAGYVLAAHWVSVVKIPKNPRKFETVSTIAFFLVQLTLKLDAPFFHKLS